MGLEIPAIKFGCSFTHFNVDFAGSLDLCLVLGGYGGQNLLIELKKRLIKGQV